MTLGHPGQMRQGRIADRMAETAARDSARGAVYLDPVDTAEAAEHAEIVARPAPDLEDAGTLGSPAFAFAERRQAFPTPPVPPTERVEPPPPGVEQPPP